MTYVETMVGIDDRYRVPALVDPEGSRWNGWLCPLFPLSSVLALRDQLDEERADSDPDGPWITVEGDRVTLHPRTDQGDDLEPVTYGPVMVDGVPYWGVGARDWTWEPADMDGEA
jgi:hypothetical protein